MTPDVQIRWLDGAGHSSGGVESLDRIEAGASVWVDVSNPDLATLQAIAERFPLHPLAIEDCLHFPQRPKLESYDGALFFIWITPVGTSGEIRKQEIDVFLGSDWIVTVHREPFDALRRVAGEAEHHLALGPDWLLHAVLDGLVDDVFPVVDSIGDHLEDLQDEMLERADQSHLEELFKMRRELIDVHKALGPERDALFGLVRERELVSEEAYRYFQDVGDHLARLMDTVETYREMAALAMDLYLSSASNRMNQVMKQLTIVATIFMPLTLITGIYGMNFRNLPELTWRYGYFGVLAAMGVVVIVMLTEFKRRGWW